MTQQDASATTSGEAPPRPRYRGRHLPMVAVVVAAFIATALAYSGMVLFGLEVANMSPMEAYALAGFLEVSLVAVALMARNAALEGRPYGVLLTLTWILSGTSGVFAALHEVAVPTESTPYMVVFRFVPPLVAALMWHLALVGERHLVTGHTLDERRREHRVHQYVTALELWRDARLDSRGDGRSMRRVRAMHERQRTARDRALKLLTVEDFERRMQVWVDRLEAAERHGNRLDVIGASSVKRGTSKGIDVLPEPPEPGAPTVPAAVEQVPAAPAVEAAPEPAAQVAARREPLPVRRAPDREAARSVEADRTDAPDDDGVTRPVFTDPDDDAPFVEALGAALAAELPSARTATWSEDSADSAPAASSPSAAPRKAPLEPLPETGHTRRVEVFDLVDKGRTPEPENRPEWHAVSESEADGAEPAGPAADESGADERSATDAADAATQPGTADEPTSERDRLIVELAREGFTQREIAEKVDASRSTVSRVVRRYEDQKPRQERAGADDGSGRELTHA